MKLVKFTLVGGGDVYVNPEQVASVKGDHYSCILETSGGEKYYISERISKVVVALGGVS
jgi:hypothetical protein